MIKQQLIQSFCIVTILLQYAIINAQKKEEVLGIDQITQEQINELFKSWDHNKTPGAAIAIIKNGEIVYTNAYGKANLEFKINNTPATLFNIASNSKQFTAFAALLLEEEGKLSLEDDIRKHIPEFPDLGETIKIKNLVQHTHGIRGITYLLGMAGWHIEDIITRKATLQLLVGQKELNFSPETDFSYNNSGYMLLAEIIERVSGKPFHEYMKTTIFNPLGMKNTVLLHDYESIIPNLSNPYYFDGSGYKKGIRNAKDIVGNTGIRTNIKDLSKWIINYEEHTVGNTKIHNRMRQPGILKNGDTLTYSYGQVVSTYKGKHILSHGGADAGYRSQILRFPEERLSIIVLANDGSLNANEKAYKIADIYLNNDANSDISRSANTVQPSKTISKETLLKYEGKFELQPGFIMEFKEKEGSLYVTATGQGTLPLETLNDREFKIRRIGAVITFIKNETGDFNTLVFNHDSQEMKGKKLEYLINTEDLEKYTGVYYSEELKTSYEIVIDNKNLIAIHPRQEETVLTPLGDQKFSGNTWFFGNLDYVFSNKQVEGFKVSSYRVQNLWFKKIGQ